ncbi:hypothetical protein UT300009_30300 [Paraclostridium bifermentans]
MKKFRVGDKVLTNVNMRVRFFDGDEKEEKYINKNIKKNEEVEIIKVEKADKSVGGCAYYIKVNIDGKDFVSSHSIPNNKFLPEELRKMLEDAKRELEEAKKDKSI